MFRYVALIWRSSDRQQAEAAALICERLHSSATMWRLALDRDGLRVYCADSAPTLGAHVLAGNAGVVLGIAFSKQDAPDAGAKCGPMRFDPQECAAIVGSRGQWLVEHCWGNYVAILRDPDGTRCHVIKDPCGTLPCFRTSFKDVTVLFSAIADCVDLRLFRFTINWGCLEQRLISGDMVQQQTALNEVTQVSRGECVEFDPGTEPEGARRHAYWHPTRFPGACEPIDQADDASRLLRNTLRACTRSLAVQHASVLLRLSGGLDSSIILVCLKDVPRRRELLAYTQYVADASSDPRPWARMAAQQASCEHIEQDVAPADIRLQALLDVAPSVEPVPASMLLTVGLQEQQLARRRAATAVFTGDGGDCAFGGMCVGEALPAYLRRHGLTSFAFRLAAQSALVLRQTAWKTLARGVRAWMTADPGSSVGEKNRDACRLVARDLAMRIDARTDPHPWLRSADRAAWEIVSKLGALLGTPDLYAGVARPSDAAPEIIAPIYAQPVMELCLRIPADVLFTGGCDRGLARRAFIGNVPEPILQRVWKDRAGTFHDQVVQLNLSWLRELLLDGVLARAGLLDRAAVEDALRHGPSVSQVHAAEIMRHAETEVWARKWLASSTHHEHEGIKTQ